MNTICKILLVSVQLLPLLSVTRGNEAYIGCFADRKDRDVKVWGDTRHWTTTVDICIEECREKGYKYAALQWGGECRCGDHYGRYGEADESDCRLKCNGNREQKCGGHWRNSIYATADCPFNQVYQKCGSHCPLTCNMTEPIPCIEMCVAGCHCPTETPFMASDGFCVVQEECPPEPAGLQVGKEWFRGSDSYLRLKRGDFLMGSKPVHYVGFSFQPKQENGLIFLVGSSSEQYMALEIVEDHLVAHWNFGFLNGSVHEAVQYDRNLTKEADPTLIKYGVVKNENMVILSVNKLLVIKEQYEEGATPDVDGDIFLGGTKLSAESNKKSSNPIRSLFTPYQGWMQDFQVNGVMSHPEVDAVENVGVVIGECQHDCDDN